MSMQDIEPEDSAAAPARKRFPSPDDVREYAKVNSDENAQLSRAMLFGSKPLNVPGAYWNWLHQWNGITVVWVRCWWVLFISLAIFYSIAYVMKLCGAGIGIDTRLMRDILLFHLFFSPMLIGRRTKRQFAKHVLQNEGAVCYNCGYLLTGLPAGHKCPECGEAFDIESLRTRWLNWMVATRQENESRAGQ